MPAILGTKLRRLAAFFGIADTEIPYWLSNIIVPVIELSPHVRLLKAAGATIDISGAPGTPVWAYGVPTGKRWTLMGAQRGACVGTASALLVMVGATSQWVRICNDTAISAQAYDTRGVRLGPGDAVGFDGTGNGGNNAVPTAVLYEEEDA